MKKRAVQRILNITPYQPGRPIDEVKRELGLKKVIKLASNETPFGPSPKVLKAIMNAAKTINRYPDGGCFYLRSALANNLKVKEDQLIFGNGSDELIIMAIRAFVEPGDEVIVSHPSFAVYGIGSNVAGASLTVVPMKEFRHDLAAVASATRRATKLIFIDNPGNPSGGYVTSDELKGFLSAVPADTVVFLDEAYYEYAVNSPGYPESLTLLKRYPNLIIARTFSKIYGLAGLRVGYAVASPEMIGIMNRVREPFNVNSVAQEAAIACLKDQKYYKQALAILEEERQFLGDAVKQLGLKVFPSATNFILIDLGFSSKEAVDGLLRKGVIIRDMAPWGLNSFIRVTIGLPEENRKFIKELRALIAGRK
ncbi:MAG: histidinol-phosphate transaminase [Candidatus Omnitrophota bacterium]